MRYIFVVQGEGRGHFTQSVAMREILNEYGHDVVKVMVGSNGKRPLQLFYKEFGDIVIPFKSPNFEFDVNGKLDIIKTISSLTKNLLSYKKSIDMIGEIISTERKDGPVKIINFYEPLFGLYNLIKGREKLDSYSIGHQFMFLHPNYIKLKEFKFERWMAKLYTWLVGAKSQKIALSFYDAPDHRDIKVIPPILRNKLFELCDKIENKQFTLVYLLNSQLSNKFKTGYQVGEIHLFMETSHYEKYNLLHIHPLDGEKFLYMMSKCKNLMCTAGFESVSEALYLGKPIQMVPVLNHMEQFYNAHDAEKNVGNCQYSNEFNISKLNHIDFDVEKTLKFKAWAEEYKNRIIKILKL